MAVADPMADTELREVKTINVREAEGARVAVTAALREAGAYDAEYLDFDLDASRAAGLLVGRPTDRDADQTTRKIYRVGHGGDARAVVIPKEALDVLDLTLEEIREADEADDPVQLRLYAGDDLIAFDRPVTRVVDLG